ncbi:hypothetical protein H9L05_05120 [Hymenobacter qilianensis]|uniref:EamA family transporter n=1 Tax=Hymenobacter qilianensis TaxID=1385715 RepID=A0A7H0GXP0_9BACT|nr:hypothetical protein [Hymenobacter qilianensis]QNP53056.1 hypothetical protein H9L05_05120 [Hymenobacter qilianensis]
MQLTRYHLAALAAFLIWGFFPIPLRMLTSYSSGQILFFRVLISLLILLVINLLFRFSAVRAAWRKWRTAPVNERRGVAGSTLLGAFC